MSTKKVNQVTGKAVDKPVKKGDNHRTDVQEPSPLPSLSLRECKGRDPSGVQSTRPFQGEGEKKLDGHADPSQGVGEKLGDALEWLRAAMLKLGYKAGERPMAWRVVGDEIVIVGPDGKKFRVPRG